MEYNPYNNEYQSLRKNLEALENERRSLIQKIDEFMAFDMDASHVKVCADERVQKELNGEFAANRDKLAIMLPQVEPLSESASLGKNPMYWFSSERRGYAEKLANLKKTIKQLTQRQQEIERILQSLQKDINDKKRRLEYFRRFDKLRVEAEASVLQSAIDLKRKELAEVRQRKEDADNKLKLPLDARNNLLRDRDNLRSDITAAEAFERQLNNASSGGERRGIHIKCEERFNNGKPADVLREKRSQLRTVERSLEKLDRRLQEISQRLQRRIELVVIDGSNLCYEADVFIGLHAVIPVAQAVREKYPDVLVVFDASMRRKLRMGDAEIANAFGKSVKVRLVASGKKADETLLDAASDKHSYVLSNDRFVDFKDKSAVAENRVCRHEIVNGKVYLVDLDIPEVLIATESTL